MVINSNPPDIGRSERLQGYMMYKMRPFLTIVSYRESPNGNICAHMIHKETGERYHHWMNEDEKKKFNEVKHLYPIFDAAKENPVKNKSRKYLLKNGVSEEYINSISEITARQEIRRIATKKRIEKMKEWLGE